MTSTTTFGSSSEASTGSTGTTGLESGFDTSSSTTSSGAECEGDSRCLPSIEGWGGPFDVISSTDPELTCPDGSEPQWRANTGVQDAECECECGPLEGNCGMVGNVHGGLCEGLPADTVVLGNGGCETIDASGAFPLLFEVIGIDTSGVACVEPVPPAPTFETNLAACVLPTTGTCEGGDCVPPMLGPSSQVCIVRPGDDGTPCPQPYTERRVAADSATADGLDCSACGCMPQFSSCVGVLDAFSDNACMTSLGPQTVVNEGDCMNMSPATLDETAALRYDAELVGECGSEVETAVAQGTPTLLGARTLCCLQ